MGAGRKNIPYFILLAGLVAADQATKALIAARLRLFESLPVIPGLLNLSRVHNRGAIFGFLNQSPHAWVRAALIGLSLAALVLVVTGLRIAGVRIVRPASAAWAEPLWQRATGLARRLGQSGSLSGRLGLGILWGWAPCALVYSALPLALVSGSALRGAAVMLAFGAGTLPALLGAGWLAGRGIGSPGPVARRVAGAALVVLALAGILQAFGIADTALGAFCVPARP